MRILFDPKGLPKQGFAYLFMFLFLMISCQKEVDSKTLQEGMYRGTLQIDQKNTIAFNFLVEPDGALVLRNAEERIRLENIVYWADSIRINFPVFEGYLKAAIKKNNLEGYFIKESLDRVVPFYAEYNNDKRYASKAPPIINVSGQWQMEFTEEDGKTFLGKGIFTQNEDKITGTIRTTTGDYRYLEGTVNNDEVVFSAFDGAHAFLFKAIGNDEALTGTFYSGNHYQATFKASRSNSFELPDEASLTYLKEGYDRLTFSFPDGSGEILSSEDKQFQDKVVVVQIMGTWCPNCLDESQYLTSFYERSDKRNLALVALAFEYAKTEDKAFKGIERLRSRLNISYPILLAQYGTSDKKEAQKKLPMLNHVLSYPTTIIIDKSGNVRKIYTGFNGPATGEKFETFKKEFERHIDEIIAE